MKNSIVELHRTFGVGIFLGFWLGFIIRGGIL